MRLDALRSETRGKRRPIATAAFTEKYRNGSELSRHGDKQPHNHDHDDHRSYPSNDKQPEIIAIVIIVAHPDTPQPR
jgi:hypothetical protein